MQNNDMASIAKLYTYDHYTRLGLHGKMHVSEIGYIAQLLSLELFSSINLAKIAGSQ